MTMDKKLNWNHVEKLTPFQTLMAFFFPSSFAFFGFRVVLPSLVRGGEPPTLMWPLIASGMLLVMVIAGVYALIVESRKMDVSFWKRALFKKLTLKQWLIALAILLVGLALSHAAVVLVEPFSKLPGLSIPSYMPFWLVPSIDPIKTDPALLSPGYPLKGNLFFVVLMGITLLLNISAEEIYFRAWLLPKMSDLEKWTPVINGLLFALYHSFQLWLFAPIAVISLATATTVYITKSIWPALAVHLVSNFLLAAIGMLMLVLG